MNIKVRISALIAGVVIVVLLISIWRFVDLQQTLRSQQAQESLRLQSSHAARETRMMSRYYKLQLIDFISEEQFAKKTGGPSVSEELLNSYLASSPFLGTAVLRLENQKWKLSSSRIRTNWPDSFMATIADNFPMEKAVDGQAIWARLVDPAGQPVFGLMSLANDGKENILAVGFLPASSLNEVAQSFLNSPIDMVLFDDHGYAFANTETSYVGSPVAEAYPGVGETLRRNDLTFDWNTRNRAKKSILANSLKVDGTNLYVMTSSSNEIGWAMLPRLVMAMLIVSLAVMFIGAGLGIWLISPLDAAIQYLSTQIFNIGQGLPVTYYPGGNVYLDGIRDDIEKLIVKDPTSGPQFLVNATQARVDSEKIGAYKEVSSGLAQALKEPLASVLAQAQLAKGKSGSEDLKEHFNVIEREARKARDTVDNLLRLSGESNLNKTRLDAQELVLGSLAAQKGLIASHDVKIVKSFQAGSMIMGNSGQLQTAFEEVIKNAVEATREKSVREIRIQTYIKEKNVEIVFEDNGVGIQNAELTKVFDPFFTSKSTDQHKGLGLTVAKGIAKGLGGKIRIESNENEGTRVIFDFPLATVRTKQFELEEKPVVSEIDEVTFSGINDKTEVLETLPADIIPMRSPRVKEQQT